MPELGQPIDATKPLRLPFVPGERVRHAVDFTAGIVTDLTVGPSVILVSVEWETDNEQYSVPWSLHSAAEEPSAFPAEVSFPWDWGQRLSPSGRHGEAFDRGAVFVPGLRAWAANPSLLEPVDQALARAKRGRGSPGTSGARA